MSATAAIGTAVPTPAQPSNPAQGCQHGQRQAAHRRRRPPAVHAQPRRRAAGGHRVQGRRIRCPPADGVCPREPAFQRLGRRRLHSAGRPAADGSTLLRAAPHVPMRGLFVRVPSCGNAPSGHAVRGACYGGEADFQTSLGTSCRILGFIDVVAAVDAENIGSIPKAQTSRVEGASPMP